jgi:D-alanyl-D-alanine carboxypeptidase
MGLRAYAVRSAYRPAEGLEFPMIVNRLLRSAAAVLLLCLASFPALAGPAIVVELQSGLVIYAEDADRAWHPASLTKLMTAYITFEELRSGKLTMDDKVTCSQHALEQQPSKVGLPVGGQMTIDLALKALIVKSANDVAVMLAEKIGGSEPVFVERMNATAARLGMTKTHFVNANGLPNDGQITTARDMAILARALRRDFPEHTHLYSLPSFKIGKRTLRTHNRLLQVFDGADGMKTGFICDSGYNIVASATRGDLTLLAVVLGEESGGARTARASQLIQYGFDYYNWKTLFAPKLSQVAVDLGQTEMEPGDMHMVVCKPHPVRKHRKPAAKAKPKPKPKA